MSQQTLASKAKVTLGLIHQLETGVILDVRSQVVEKLAKALGVPYRSCWVRASGR